MNHISLINVGNKTYRKHNQNNNHNNLNKNLNNNCNHQTTEVDEENKNYEDEPYLTCTIMDSRSTFLSSSSSSSMVAETGDDQYDDNDNTQQSEITTVTTTTTTTTTTAAIASDKNDDSSVSEFKFKDSIEVDSSMVRHLIGYKYQTINSIMKKSNTRIILPTVSSSAAPSTTTTNTNTTTTTTTTNTTTNNNNQQQQQHQHHHRKRHHVKELVWIHANELSDIELAKNEILQLIESKLPFTHFLSLHLVNDPTVHSKLSLFFDDLKVTFPSIHSTVYISPNRFHFTIQMLRLFNQDKIDQMKQLLNDEIQPIINELFSNNGFGSGSSGSDDAVEFDRLDTFRDRRHTKLSHTSVVFLKPKTNTTYDRIMEMGNRIKSVLLKYKLINQKESQESLVLHATVMNAKYGNIKGFDAEQLLNQFGTMTALESKLGNNFKVPLTTLELSKLVPSKTDVRVNGFYAAEAIIQFPPQQQQQQ